jgi:RND family efflux transporter MFP subunit
MSDRSPVPPEGLSPRARPARPVRPGILFYLFWLALTAGIGLALFRVISNRQERLHAQEVAVRQEASAGLPVAVGKPKRSGEVFDMQLPADVRASLESPIYAKVSGYLKQIYVDKGDHVKKGQLLAVLENPEAEQEYRTAQHHYDIAKITNDRNQQLVRDRVLAQQVADRSQADFLMAQSNLERLRTMLEYRQLRAPFDGVVVSRNYDPGVLVPATTTNTASSAVPVLVVAKVDTLRVYVYVPQSDAAFIRVGDPAELTFQEFPGKVFRGRIARFARALDMSSRTMLTEIDLPNPGHTLLPGMFGAVTLRRKQPQTFPIIPNEALVFRNEKPFVPVVTADNRLRLQPVTLGFDNGSEIQITSGLRGDETIALSVGQTVTDGILVQPVVRTEPAPGGAPATAGPRPPAPPPAQQTPARRTAR